MLKLNVTASGDGLGAKLRFEGFDPSEWKTLWAGPDGREAAPKLRENLILQGIAEECLRTEILEWIARTLNQTNAETLAKDLRAVQDVDVAQGKAPQAEQPEGLVFQRSYLTNEEAIADLRRKADAWGFEGVRDSLDPAYWVNSGETVMTFQGVAKGRNGMDVFGAAIPFAPLRDCLPAFGKSLYLKDRRLLAVCEGVLIIEDGALKVLGADSMPTCQVVVSEDRMSAELVLGGNHLNDWAVTPDMVQSALREQGVLCMLPMNEIQASLDKFNQDYLPLTLIVAQGRPPVPGREGRLSMLIDPEPEVPLPSADGSIDFKNFSFFRTVSKGARIAQVMPPVPGEPGMNVHGEEIPAEEVSAFATEPGKNTTLEGFDPLFVIASVSGRLAVKNGIPEVVEVLDVDGDVSLKTGNIDFPGAVRVTGDVHSKMQIQALGDVEIVGTVEDSIIRSDGAIVIKGGVSGLGNGIIKSRLSNVTIGYLHNQRIESHSNIVVFNEIINSTLLARKGIQMKFGKFAVLGGHLLAGEKMDLFNVGSEAGSKTILEVGKDFEVEADMVGKNERLQDHTLDLEFLKGMDEQLAGIIRLRRGGADEELMLQKRTQGAMEILQRWIGNLRRELADLSRRLYTRGTCEIIIRGIAHPGTVLKYHDSVLVLPMPVTSRKWVFKEKGALPSIEGQAV